MSSRRNKNNTKSSRTGARNNGPNRRRRGRGQGAGGNEPGNGNPRIENSVIGGIAQRVRRRVRYVEFFTLAGTTTVASRTYALNGLYDPYLGTGGHQPSNFDFWMQMYGFYNVVKCHVTMQYMNDATGTSQPAAFGMLPSTLGNAVTAAGTVTYLKEKGRAIFSDIPSGIVNAPVSRPLKMHYAISDFADGADTRGMSTYWGTSSTNPGSLAYVELFHGSMNGSATGTFSYCITLDYDVEFWGPLPEVNSITCECGAKMAPKWNFCGKCGEKNLCQTSHPQEVDEKKGGRATTTGQRVVRVNTRRVASQNQNFGESPVPVKTTLN